MHLIPIALVPFLPMELVPGLSGAKKKKSNFLADSDFDQIIVRNETNPCANFHPLERFECTWEFHFRPILS